MAQATGGNSISEITISGKKWFVHTFTSNGTFTTPGPRTVEVLVVAVVKGFGV